MLIGCILQNIRVVIVPEEQLDVTKSKFHSLTSVHVYSVQKAKVKVHGIIM